MNICFHTNVAALFVLSGSFIQSLAQNLPNECSVSLEPLLSRHNWVTLQNVTYDPGFRRVTALIYINFPIGYSETRLNPHLKVSKFNCLEENLQIPTHLDIRSNSTGNELGYLEFLSSVGTECSYKLNVVNVTDTLCDELYTPNFTSIVKTDCEYTLNAVQHPYCVAKFERNSRPRCGIVANSTILYPSSSAPQVKLSWVDGNRGRVNKLSYPYVIDHYRVKYVKTNLSSSISQRILPTSNTKEVSTCPTLSNCNSSIREIVIDKLEHNATYRFAICAVLKPRAEFVGVLPQRLPVHEDFFGWRLQILDNPVYIPAASPVSHGPVFWMSVVGGPLLAIVVVQLIFLGAILWRRRQRRSKDALNRAPIAVPNVYVAPNMKRSSRITANGAVITLVTLLCLVTVSAAADRLPQVDNPEYCATWCLAKCMAKSSQAECALKCAAYNSTSLCDDSADKVHCQATCLDLFDPYLERPSTPSNENVRLSITDKTPTTVMVNVVNFTMPSNGQLLFVIEMEQNTNDLKMFQTLAVVSANELPFEIKNAHQCPGYELRIAAVTRGGLSDWSPNFLLPVASTDFKNHKWFKQVNMTYEPNIPMRNQYFTNEILDSSSVFAYLKLELPIGFEAKRLQPQPDVQKFHCLQPEVGRPEPVPKLQQVSEAESLFRIQFPARDMSQNCIYYVLIHKAKDVLCETTYIVPISNFFRLNVRCKDVINANKYPKCAAILDRLPLPHCGIAANTTVNYPRNKHGEIIRGRNVSVNVTWHAPNKTNADKRVVQYYHIRLGRANTTAKPTHTLFDNHLNVPMTGPYKDIKTCSAETGVECNSTIRTVQYTDLAYGTYGIAICAVYKNGRSVQDDSDFTGKPIKKLVNKLEIKAPPKKQTNPLLWAAIVGAPLICLIVLLAIASAIVLRRNRSKQEALKEEIHKMEENYYKTTAHDLWECSRMELDIHDDVILGKGAFGIVYKGRLLKARAHKDVNSSIASVKKRFENCHVAIKRLPDYATEPDKDKFLSEIALMKRLAQDLGFYEHMVNPLACITKSMPYCLVMEYCNGGNLLDFLRERREYMIKLDEAKINYTDPQPEDNVNVEMLLTARQMLQFAVNVVYAMEHISSKGYVHRDLAARNILVHEGRYAKVADFGMTRKVDEADPQYLDVKGGKVPIKWLALESLKGGEYSVKSDVWSFGVLLFEIMSLGGSPYPNISPHDVLPYLETGQRMRKPDHCDDETYDLMLRCWNALADERPTFSDLRECLASKYDEVTEEYNYIPAIDPGADYYQHTYPLAPMPHQQISDDSQTTPEPISKQSVQRTDSGIDDDQPLDARNSVDSVSVPSTPTSKKEAVNAEPDPTKAISKTLTLPKSNTSLLQTIVGQVDRTEQVKDKENGAITNPGYVNA